MSFKKKSMAAGLISAAIILPTSTGVSFANGNNEGNLQIKSVDHRVVTGNSVNFRKGPGTNYNSIGKLNKGDRVEYLETVGSWIKVKYNSNEGFVHSNYISTSSNTGESNEDTSVKSEKQVTGNRVNFRKGPGTSYSIITSLNKGTKVGYISENNGWAKISYNGNIGYMSTNYLATIDSNSGGNNSGSNEDSTVKSEKQVTGNRVNFRKGPGTNYSVITSLNKGTKVGYISESNGWAKVNYNGTIGYMSANYIGDVNSNPGAGESGTSQGADAVISLAKQQLGKPYVWGAEGPSSFDCSGFTQYVFKNAAGKNLPRVSKEQSKFGQSVNKSNLQKGDLIFFDTDKDGVVNHVGIYMGNNEFIHASSGGKKVIISQLNSYYNSVYTNARRVL
ncbi:MAG: SH3 domain-containing protein [Paeniclostridium sp.]|uniref:C40 family peptidase n=1 Tax=Paraclostridium sordellii TaxID=1505 RepID=UPI0005DE3A8C|nr:MULTISPECIES: C40 family peptidase [Paeniclostridium]MBS6024919.1 SH3 domain-containing protein [Paeniclostridium sordellii]MBW4863267.1 SH3 domain-containing protein [Paeniclostridium sp.]MBW4873246.1 SH3 domain-containing protein [Paeniclostridium sp.]CEN92519.1 cell wall hydrolase; phosphatase-associated protein [[Clostridium] sordellii] [Paeniclostridium sordellii]CEN96763.1 cell wall hydrolase%3B phosphatase-associated protein [[Clostridium] sordellii] [Paeniclostridium sordellii]